MLTPDDLKNGMVFILQLRAADGAPVTWLETLRGDGAARRRPASRPVATPPSAA